jgi:hypothetical protein
MDRDDEDIASIGVVVSTMDNENYAKFRYTTTDRYTDE